MMKLYLDTIHNSKKTHCVLIETCAFINYKVIYGSGLENSTRPLVFTSVLGCRASEYFDIFSEN